MEVLRFVERDENAETVAFAAALLCVWAAGQAALWLPHKTPRLVTALALFALNWAILLLYYLPGPPQNEILPAFSGFVLVYIGILLLRDARETDGEARASSESWIYKLPLHLFRVTVLGFGVYLIARRIFHVEYGYSTLALALWGTVLTVLGYLAIWLGVTYLHAGSKAFQQVCLGLGLLLALYSCCEWLYFGWYARQYWPVYHQYLVLQSQRRTPDFEQALPFEPQPNWPEAAKWAGLHSRSDWPRIRALLALSVVPRLPQMGLGLKYAFALLKLVFTAAFLILVWRRPRSALPSPPPRLVRWLDGQLKLGPPGYQNRGRSPAPGPPSPDRQA